jgi:hypothetical protein
MSISPKHARIENDLYETPAALTEGLLTTAPYIAGKIFEPCAGGGSIARVLTARGLSVTQSDITKPVPGAPSDAATKEFWGHWGEQNFDWVVTNPPYGDRLPDKILPLAFDNVNRGMAMLLRITYSEPCASRSAWLKAHEDCLRQKIDISPRPRFRLDTNKTDACTVSWFIWDKEFSWAALGVASPFVSFRYERAPAYK